MRIAIDEWGGVIVNWTHLEKWRAADDLTLPLKTALSADRLKTCARWSGTILVLSTAIPCEVVGRQPYFLWQTIQDLPPAGMVASTAPAVTGVAILASAIVFRQCMPLALAILSVVGALLVATSIGADTTPWDVLPVPESWTHGAGSPIVAIALAAAAVTTDWTRRPKATRRALVATALGLTVIYYLTPVLGEPPVATALRVFDINLRQQFYSPEIVETSLQLANVLKLNDQELPVLAAMFGLRGGVREQLAALTEQFGLRAVALTRGAGGSLLHKAASLRDAKPKVAASLRDAIIHLLSFRVTERL